MVTQWGAMFPLNQYVQTPHQLISPSMSIFFEKLAGLEFCEKQSPESLGILWHTFSQRREHAVIHAPPKHTHIPRHSRDMGLNFPCRLFLFFPVCLSSVWSAPINNLWINIKWSVGGIGCCRQCCCRLYDPSSGRYWHFCAKWTQWHQNGMRLVCVETCTLMTIQSTEESCIVAVYYGMT